MEFVDQRRNHVRPGGLEMVAVAIDVARHEIEEIGAVLLVRVLAELHPGNLGDGIALVGWFECSGQDVVLVHGLRTFARIDAGAAQEQQLCHLGNSRGVDHVHRDHQIFVQEFDRIARARADAADAAGEMEDKIDRVLREEFMSRGLIAQIKLLGRRRKNARIAIAAQTLNERLADHPAPTSDEYARRFFHVNPGL